MVSLGDRIHLVLIKTEQNGDTTLVSSHYLEWRVVLAAPGARCSIAVELLGIGEKYCWRLTKTAPMFDSYLELC